MQGSRAFLNPEESTWCIRFVREARRGGEGKGMGAVSPRWVCRAIRVHASHVRARVRFLPKGRWLSNLGTSLLCTLSAAGGNALVQVKKKAGTSRLGNNRGRDTLGLPVHTAVGKDYLYASVRDAVLAREIDHGEGKSLWPKTRLLGTWRSNASMQQTEQLPAH